MHLSSEAVGARLQEQRKALGHIQGSFASELGISKRTLASYEAGTSDIGSSVLAVAARLGVDVLYVLTGQLSPLSADSLAPQEDLLLRRYRQLNGENQALLERLCGALAGQLPPG